MERRDFLKQLWNFFLLIGGWPFLESSISKELDGKSRIVIAHHPQVFNFNGTIETNVLQYMIDEGMKALTGKFTVREAWQFIFSDYEWGNVVGLKINCVTDLFPTHPELVDVVSNGLTTLFPDNDIIVWDRQEMALLRAGYPINTSSAGVRYLATDSPGVSYDFHRSLIYNKLPYYVTSIVTTMCDFLVNLPVLKDHRVAGVTLGMKNFYGAITLNDFFPNDDPHIRMAHRNNCNPQIPYLNRIPEIKDKNRLIILDALEGVYDGGPIAAPQWQNNMLILGCDPVAVDFIGMLLIELKRRENGLPSIIHKARYLRAAAFLGLGKINPKDIDLIILNLG